MEKHFQEIKNRYEDFYRQLMKNGRLPMKDTGKGFWNAAITDEVFEIFSKIGLTRFNHLLDIGSGDGKIALLATLFGVKATGIEFDKELSETALKMQKELSHIKHTKKCTFVCDDFYKHSFKDFDILFCNPDEPMHRGLERKLLEELNGKLILYGHHFHPRHLRKEKSFEVNGTPVTVYSNTRIG